MFDTLSDRIRQDENVPGHKTESVLRYALVLVISVVLFGGLYLVVQHLGG